MADLSVKPVATDIKPMPSISLADMINIARGAQAYQSGEVTLEQQTVANEEQRRVAEAVKQDPNLFMTDNRLDLDKINRIIPQLAPRTQDKYLATYNVLNKAQTDAIQAKMNLGQDLKSIIGSRYSTLGYAGIQDPALYIAEGERMKKDYPDQPDLHKYIDAANTSFKIAQPGPQVADMAIKGAQSLLRPTEIQSTFAPQTQVTAGGQTVTTQRMPGTAPTKTEIGIAGGLQQPTPAPAAEPGMPYPKRSATQPFIPEPGEQADREAGQTYRTKLVNTQTNLATNRRNVEEVINKAKEISGGLYFEKGGIPGAIERRIRMAISSEDYDMLAKDLANMALSNSQALGSVGNTVAGLDMQAVANGTIKVPPDVLVQIARRVQADQTNLDMQANGAQRFAERYGDNNMKRFQQNWNANADTKIFEVMNIYRDETDPAVRQQQIDKLLGKDPKKRKEFFDKYNNLKKLSETGSL